MVFPRSFTAAVDRLDRSRGQSIESIGSVILWILSFFRDVGDLSGVKVSAVYDAWRPKTCRKTETQDFEFFGSVGSVFCSVRSILGVRVVVDPSDNAAADATSSHAQELVSQRLTSTFFFLFIIIIIIREAIFPIFLFPNNLVWGC